MSHAKRCADKGVASEGTPKQATAQRPAQRLSFCGAVLGGGGVWAIFCVAIFAFNGGEGLL